MRSNVVLGLAPHGFHRLHYTEWGDPDNPRVLICVHGLTRTGRDFDALAAALAQNYRVVCPDMPGRGRSDWLEDKSDYSYSVYMSDIAVLLGRLGAEEIDWVGTSMGGLIGLFLAAQPQTPIRRMVLNDIGPFVEENALVRIMQYVGTDPRFADMQALEQYLRTIHAPFGPLTDPQWRHLAEHSARSLPEGGFALHYDPGIAMTFKDSASSGIDLWEVWDRIECPVRALRGSQSDLLSAPTATEMKTRGPRSGVIEFPGVGHAPMLMSDDQIEAVRDWLIAP